MNELPKAETLELLNNLKKVMEERSNKAHDNFCLHPNISDSVAYDICLAYAAALETAIRCVEEGEEE